ncbi:MAG: DUF1292 domain-containing protein [Clostridia bacterium]|nr:DUF1292 domain-containing protein [Clostridia bacterium]
MAELPENPHLIDLIDEDGETVTFEHLDTVQYKDNDYVICIPFDDDEEVVTEVVIFKIRKDNEDDCLEQVEDIELLDKVYDIFKERNGEMFDFED